MSTKKSKKEIVIRALRTTQGKDLDVFAFFVKGADIVKVADISRIERTEGDLLKGFQRTEIRNHVKGIVDYLNLGNVLFPNAIILAMSPEVVFKASRGTKPTGDESIAESGTLTIPINGEGNRVAWIVDGQQRSLALAQAFVIKRYPYLSLVLYLTILKYSESNLFLSIKQSHFPDD